MRRFARALAALSVLFHLSTPVLAAETVTIFAAASLKNALDEAATAYRASTGVEIVTSYAATSALTKQVQQGAPADIFASADAAWMEELEKGKFVVPGSRVDLLGNELALVAPRDSAPAQVSLDEEGLIGALGDGRLAVGEVNAVPAGRYANAALTALGLWEIAEPRLAQTENVRAALALVARGEARLGIVYATDAAVEPGVRIVATFPEGSHPAIVYPFALVGEARPAAQAFLDFLKSKAGLAIFRKAGFTTPTTP